MLDEKTRRRLHENFVRYNNGSRSMENFALRENLRVNSASIAGKIRYSCVAYIDIAGFSTKIQGWSTRDIKTYLDAYYNSVMPIISAYNGEIDRIMGDGIIVVFSEVFGIFKNTKDAISHCVMCCAKCIEKLHDTEFAVKAAIGDGNLYFCVTGVEDIYEDLTCIGHPLTIAHRLENVADVNQILYLKDAMHFDEIDAALPDTFYRCENESIFCGLSESEYVIAEYDGIEEDDDEIDNLLL